LKMFETARAAGKTDCALSHFFNDIRGGVKDGNTVFGGLDGLTYLFGKLKGEITTLQTNNIPALELGKKGAALEEAVTAYYDKFSGATIPSCNPENFGKMVQPDSIIALTPRINKYVDKETEMLSSAGMLIDFGGTMINNIVDEGIGPFDEAIDDFLVRIKSFRQNITELETTIHDNVDYNNRVSLFDTLLIFSVGGSAFILLVFFILMTCSLKLGKCVKFTTFFQSLLAISKISFSVIVNAAAIACIAVSIISMNGCYFGKLAIDDRVWTERIVGTENMKYFDLCLFKTSSGNLTTLLPEEQTQEFTYLQIVINGFDINLDSLNITNDEPPSIKFYHEEILQKWKTYENPDFTNNQEDSPEKQVLAANKIVYCTDNEFEVNPKKCSFTPISTLADAVDYRNTQEYCIVPSLFNWKDINSR